MAASRASERPKSPSGERNGLSLWEEIKAQGCTGSSRTVYRYLKTLKQVEVKAEANPQRIQKYTSNAAARPLTRDPKSLDELEKKDLAVLYQASTALRSAYDLVQDFLTMVHK